ncbi:MAG: ATP-binding cassette domain-containing protein [Candidatus Methanomethyliaceae archaeon]
MNNGVKPEGEVLLEIKNVKKSFGTVKALSGISFSVRRGEVVGLLGDNGAGKSTLIKLIMGIYEPDEGEIIFEGRKLGGLSPSERRSLGIEAVPQGGAVVPYLDIARNLFLGREPTRKQMLGILDLQRMHEEAKKVVEEIGVSLRSTYERVSHLSGGERQAVSIGRTLYFGGKLVLLDEPTLNLSVKETDKLHEAISMLKVKGVGVIYVTHNVHHVYDIGDRFVILNKGEMLGVLDKERVTPIELMDMIRRGQLWGPKE